MRILLLIYAYFIMFGLERTCNFEQKTYKLIFDCLK